MPDYRSPQVADLGDVLYLKESRKGSRKEGEIWVFTSSELINGLMQLIALIIAIIFGVWAVKSFDAAREANSLAMNSMQQAVVANKLALLALCSGQVEYPFLCVTVC